MLKKQTSLDTTVMDISRINFTTNQKKKKKKKKSSEIATKVFKKISTGPPNRKIFAS